jgi:carbamoyltransferase
MNILGISGGLTHDAAACLVSDGKLVAMVEEERFLRQKHAIRQLPLHSTLYCLTEAKLSLADIDIVVCSWDPMLDREEKFLNEFAVTFKEHEIFSRQPFPDIEYVDHHTSHAAASLFFCGFQTASVLVVDGSGENFSTSIGVANNGEITFFKQFDISDSLGHFYRRITRHLSLGHSAEGKLMGLAAYGKPCVEFPIRLSSDGYSTDVPRFENIPPLQRYDLIKDWWEKWLIENIGPPVIPSYLWSSKHGQFKPIVKLDELHKDLAASAQDILEQVIVNLAHLAVNQTGYRNLAFSGGVALNCGVNSAMLRSGVIDKLCVFPAANDSGAAVGAALITALKCGDHLEAINHVFYGPWYPQAITNRLLDDLGIAYKVYPQDRLVKYIADILRHDRVVGWFQDRTEFGPRALGHRSIIASPNSILMRDRINQKVKYREEWRPLAPSLPLKDAGTFFAKPYSSPYMLHFFDTTKRGYEELAAIVHVDGTSRPQFIEPSTDPLFYELLMKVGEYTGNPVVINTSLNNRGEPIANSIVDALHTFISSDMDVLVLGEAVIEK